jgi:hypothetical protein
MGSADGAPPATSSAGIIGWQRQPGAAAGWAGAAGVWPGGHTARDGDEPSAPARHARTSTRAAAAAAAACRAVATLTIIS